MSPIEHVGKKHVGLAGMNEPRVEFRQIDAGMFGFVIERKDFAPDHVAHVAQVGFVGPIEQSQDGTCLEEKPVPDEHSNQNAKQQGLFGVNHTVVAQLHVVRKSDKRRHVIAKNGEDIVIVIEVADGGQCVKEGGCGVVIARFKLLEARHESGVFDA